MILELFSFCSPTRKMQFYSQFKQEIVKDVFYEFEKYLPASYKNCLMAKIRYAPSFKALECSGIDVLFGLNDLDFEKNIQVLYHGSNVPSELFLDTMALSLSNSEYFSLNNNLRK
jgi:hypothetical protein